MSRPRRDPRAEAARHAVPGGNRPRSTIEVAAAVVEAGSGGRPRRDPRAELAALLVPAVRRRLDRMLAAAGPGAAADRAARGTAAAVADPAAAAAAAAVPAVRTIAAPAFHVLVVPDADTGRAGAHDRQLLGAARLLADAAGGAVVVAAEGGEWGPLGADRVISLNPSEAEALPPGTAQPSPLEGGGLPRAAFSERAGRTSFPHDGAARPGGESAFDPALRAAAVAAAVRTLEPRHVLFAETADGGDLARRVAAALGEPLFAGAESLTARAVTRPARAGRTEQRAAPPRLISLLTDVVAAHAGPPHEARPATLADLAGEGTEQRGDLARGAEGAGEAGKARDAGEAEEAGSGRLVRPADQLRDSPPAGRGEVGGLQPAAPRAAFLAAETIPADPAVVPLAEANFVVSVGNGVTDLASFHELVAALGATPGASRVVCDAGLMPRDRQVGASGTVLDATCYFALGIAGAPQHLQGVAKCEHVVAVNTDLHAAMIERAGLAVVADAQQVMPALLRRLAAEQGVAEEARSADAGAPGDPADADGTAGHATTGGPATGSTPTLAGGHEARPATRAGVATTLATADRSTAGNSPLPGAALEARVLLSAGRHPVSARGAPVRTEAQAIALAAALGAALRGLHAGVDAGAVADHFGHGLGAIDLVTLPEGGDGATPRADPVPVLVAALAADPPDLVLCGRRAEGGDDCGLVPYALAAGLGWPIVADAVALARDPGDPAVLVVEQALPRGARRRVRVRLPAVVTVHPAAPPPRPFAFGPSRRGEARTLPAVSVPVATAPAPAVEERPWRRRPRLIAGAATGGSAAERLKAATEVSGGGGRLLVDPDLDAAALEILAFLRGIGVLPPPPG